MNEHIALPPKNLGQVIWREQTKQWLNRIKEPHCIVCGDTENDGKILQIPIKNGECILFCEFCYKIQSKMRN